jgi:GNAT superfamily N-acetyltransferase
MRITDYEQLAPTLETLLRAGAVTNKLPNRETLCGEIAAGTLWAELLPEGVLLLQRRPGFQRMQFVLHRDAPFPQWQPTMPTVVEIPFRPTDTALQAVDETLGARDFSLALTRVRLTRKANAAPVSPPEDIFPAGCDQAQAVRTIFTDCFSPLTGCLPDEAALQAALRQEEILYCDGGLLHYSPNLRTTELRHLAVAADHRGQGLARRLIAAYLARCGHQLSRVWTGEDNQVARHLYESFQYQEDPWRSHVRIYEKG